MIDAYGNFYPDWPGQPDPRFNRQALPNPWQPPASAPQPQPPQQAHQAAPAAPQTVTKAIIPIEKIEDSSQYHVAPGQSMIFLTSDEQTFVVKEGTSDGTGYTLGIYDRRAPAPPAQPAPIFDPRQYFTRDETIRLVQDILTSSRPTYSAASTPSVQEMPSQRHSLAENSGEAQK